MELHSPLPIIDFDNSAFHKSGLKIFNFHPNTIYLNSFNMETIKIMQKKYKDTTKAEIKFMEDLINIGKGVGDTFLQLVKFLSKNGKSKTLNELDSQ